MTTPSQGQRPHYPKHKKGPFLLQGKDEAASLELVPKSHFPIFHLVSPSFQSPQEGQVLPLHLVDPARKSQVSPGTRDGPALQVSKGPERARGMLRSHNREDRSGLRQQLLSLGITGSFGGGWQSLTLPSSCWTFCLPMSVVLPHRSPWQTHKESP